MAPWLRYLIAFVVFCHGFIYLRVGPLFFTTVKAWKGTSWLLGGAFTGERLKGLITILNFTAGIVTIGCALAIAFAPSAPGLWRPLAVASGIVGIAAFFALWDGQTRLLFEEGAMGAAVSLVLLGGALVFGEAFS